MSTWSERLEPERHHCIELQEKHARKSSAPDPANLTARRHQHVLPLSCISTRDQRPPHGDTHEKPRGRSPLLAKNCRMCFTRYRSTRAKSLAGRTRIAYLDRTVKLSRGQQKLRPGIARASASVPHPHAAGRDHSPTSPVFPRAQHTPPSKFPQTEHDVPARQDRSVESRFRPCRLNDLGTKADQRRHTPRRTAVR